MPKFVDGELGSSVRAKINTVIDKVEGAATIDNDITISGDLTAESIVKVGTGTGGAGTDTNMVTTSATSAWLNVKGGAGRAKITLGNDDTHIVAGSSGEITFRTGAGSTDLGTDVARVTSDGLAIGATSLDAGNKLQVEGGDIKVSDTVAALTLEDSDDPNNAYTRLQSYGGVAIMDVDPGNNGGLASSLRVNIDGTERMRVDSAGMSVTGTVDISDDLSLTNAGNSPLIMRDSSETNGYQIRPNVSSSLDYGLLFERLDGRNWYVMGGQVRSHAFYDDSESEALVIDHSGNVGIKNTNPSYSLDVSGDIRLSDDYPQLFFKDERFSNTHRIIASDGYLYIQADHRSDPLSNAGNLYLTGYNSVDAARIEARASIFEVENNGTSRLYINASGDVGLGTTGPAERLDVNGNILARGNLTAHQYHTRADFVADTNNRAAGLVNGDIVMAEGLFYEYSSGSTTLDDLPSFVPAGTVQPEHFGAVGNGVVNDYADLAAFFSYLPGRVGALRQNATYRSDSKLTIPGGGFTLHSNGATISFAAMGVNTTGSFLGLAGSAGSDISISSIVETVNSNNTVSVLVTTSSAHGLSVGDDVLLHSDDVIDIGHDATQERRGQLGYVTKVESTTQFKILQPLYETLPTNPKMRPITWKENFRFAGTLRLVGPGRRTEVAGAAGLNLTYCRDYEIEKIETIDVDSQAVVEESCTRGHTQHVHCEFPDQGGVTHEQYGLTWKNVVTDLRCDLLTGYRGKHLFDHTRNTNPGIGRNCRIGHIRAYGTWEAAAAMHGNARDCSIGFVEAYNCLYGPNIRAPGWRIDDTYAEHCSEVVRLTDNPRRVSLGSVRGKNVTYGLRATDTVNGFIGTVEAGRISVDLVNVEECTGNAVHLDFSDVRAPVTNEPVGGIPVFTHVDAPVTGGTTTSVTFGNLPKDMYNNSGALTGAQLTIDPDGGGSAATVSRVVTHTYSNGVNTLTWSSAISTAPVAGVATYTIRSFVDDIEIGRVISKNTASADVYIFGNCRRVSIGEITATHDTVTATNALWLKTTPTIYPEGVSIGRMYIENKLDPLIEAEAQNVSFHDVSSDPDGNVRIDGALTINGGMSIDAPNYSGIYGHHVLRDVAMWAAGANTTTGALVVQLGGLGNTFISATITIFRNYSPPVDVHVWGYSRSANSDWTNEGARVSDPSIVSEVRFARDKANNYPYVILSNNATPTASTWTNYVEVRVKEITLGWTGTDNAFNQNPSNYVTTLNNTDPLDQSASSAYDVDSTVTPTSPPVNVQRYTNDIAFYDDSGSQAVFFDGSTSRLGIGETAPTVTLDVGGSARIQSTMQVNELIRQATKTVATLPTSGVFAGDRSFVTDATATTFASVVAGGGSNKVPVYYDGTNWRIG